MQENQIQKMQQVLIHQNLLKKVDLANLKSNVDKLNIDKFKNVPTNLSNLKSKVDKLDVDKVMLLKKMYIMLRSKLLKIKYLTLLT